MWAAWWSLVAFLRLLALRRCSRKDRRGGNARCKAGGARRVGDTALVTIAAVKRAIVRCRTVLYQNLEGYQETDCDAEGLADLVALGAGVMGNGCWCGYRPATGESATR